MNAVRDEASVLADGRTNDDATMVVVHQPREGECWVVDEGDHPRLSDRLRQENLELAAKVALLEKLEALKEQGRG